MAWLAETDVNGNGSRTEGITRCCCVLCCATDETGPLHISIACSAPTWPQRQQRRFPLQLAQSVFIGEACFVSGSGWFASTQDGAWGAGGPGKRGGIGQATAQHESGCDELSSDLSDAVRRGPDARACAPLLSWVRSS